MYKGQTAGNSLDLEGWKQDQRIQKLEERASNKKTSNKPTEAQLFLLFYYDGRVESIKQDDTRSQKQKDKSVSGRLGINVDNARKFLSEITKTEWPLLKTKSNYTFLVDFYKSTGEASLQRKAEIILLEILNLKEKQSAQK